MQIINTSHIKNWPDGVLLASGKITQDLSPEILSTSELQEYESFANHNRKAEYLLGRHLFHLLLNESNINPKNVELLREERGKPYAKYGTELINVSFTHSPVLVMCAISRNRNIGLDTESTKREVDNRVVKRILNEREWEVIGRENPLKLWTIKEAALKCSGIGLQTSLKNLFIHKRENNRYSIRFNNDINYEICSFKQLGHQIALAYQSINF